MGFAINGQVLNASRIARIQNARSLGEAQQMGLFDWIRDRLRGGVKRAAIEDAFNKLQSVKQDDSSAHAHGGLLMHFAILRDAMKPEFASGCALETSINEAQQAWSYRMKVDGKTLAEGTDLPIGDGQTLTAFQDFQLSSGAGALIHSTLPGVDPQKTVNGLQEAFGHINQAHNLQFRTNSLALLEKSQKIVEVLRKDYPALSTQHLKFDFKPGHESSAGDGRSQAGTVMLTLAGRELIRIPITDAGVLKSVLMAQAELELKRIGEEQEYIGRDMIAEAIKDILIELDRSIMSVLNQDATRNLFSNRVDYEQYVVSLKKELSQLQVGQTTFGNVIGVEHDRSAIKIQSHLRGFLARKDLTPVNDFGFKVMSQAGKRYYFDESKTISHLKTPDNAVLNGPKGGFKTLTHSDERFVQLKNLTNKPDQFKTTNLIAKELSSFSSVCSGYYVENGTMVARNGGEALVDAINDGKVFPLKAFKIACEELNTMHDKQIYMRDIKPDNLVINDGVIRHVDLDMVVTPTHGNYALRCGTMGYMTTYLLADRTNQDVSIVRRSLKSGDQFALLNSIMLSTTSPIGKVLKMAKSFPRKNDRGVSLKAVHKNWINQHVRAEYKAVVINFLQNPSQNTLNAPLHEMINWNS